MNLRTIRIATALTTTFSLAGFSFAPAFAEEADEQSSEIIVTGERLSRTQRETAASVEVVDADKLNKLQADRVEQILALTPNVQLGGGDQGPTIRGQDSTGVLLGADAFLGGSRPRATVRIDARDVSFNEFIYGLASVWDVERVEVFRSPQTTTQGRNSIAGAVYISTQDPSYEFEGRARGIIGSARTYQGSLALSGPIVKDQLAARVSVDVRKSRTWAILPETIPDIDEKDDDFGVVRVKLLAEPEALPGTRFELSYVHTSSQALQAETVRPPFKARRNDEGGGGYWKTNVDSLTGIFDYAINPDLKLSITSSYGDVGINRFAPPGDGNARVDTRDVSVETILAGKVSDGVKGLFGVYWLDTNQRERIDLSNFLGLGEFSDKQNSFGVFGEGTVRLADPLALTLGARYQRDHQRRIGTLGTSDFAFSVDYDRSFDAFLPKLSLAYDVSGKTTIGLLAQKAFNPGGTTISFVTGEQDEFDAETLWSYEAFVRTSALDGRLSLNGNIFYTDFKNAQRSLFTTVTLPSGATELITEIANAPKSTSYGLELAVGYAPSKRFSINAGVGLLKTKINRTVDPTDPIQGKNFQRAPKFSGSLSATWEPIDGLTLDTQLRHNSRYFSDDANTPAQRITGSTTLDAKASYIIGQATVFAYGRNLFDSFYLTQLFQPDFGYAGDPREYGVGIEFKF